MDKDYSDGRTVPGAPNTKSAGEVSRPCCCLQVSAGSLTDHVIHNQLFLTITNGHKQVVVTIPMLLQALKVMLQVLKPDTSLYFCPSLRRVGATPLTGVGTNQLLIKCHGMWASKAFGGYIMTRCGSGFLSLGPSDSSHLSTKPPVIEMGCSPRGHFLMHSNSTSI